ncbi:MAG: dehydrogenase, partial [Gammaproteobacteria bacterium]|nr:dehydrogenase [Gammaproteobacteria bacterium]
MKTVVSISLGTPDLDYDFQTEFLGQSFRIVRIGTNKDMAKAEALIREWAPKADAIGLGMVRDHYNVGSHRFIQESTQHLETLVDSVPITTGARLRGILHDWSIRSAQSELGNFFNNSKIFFFSGMQNYRPAAAMAEWTDNLVFADPVLQLGIPKMLTSIGALELYARGAHSVHRWKAPHVLSPSIAPIKEWNQFIIRKAVQKADVVVGRFDEIEALTPEELGGKVVITSLITDERLETLRDRGVNIVLDCTPQIFDLTVGINVIEAMILAALNRRVEDLTQDDYLEIITSLNIQPRILYPSGFKRMSRFAFVIHPLSQQYLRKSKPVDMVARVAPKPVMNAVEKIIAYSPPFVYSKVSGVKSPTGAETEGWLISVGGTPKEMMAHSP